MEGRRYFVSDLDGTLLDNVPELSDLTIETIKRLAEADHVISFSTARSIKSAQRVARSVLWSTPVTVYNGALIVEMGADPSTLRILDRRLPARDLIREVIDLGERCGLSPFLYLMDDAGNERVHHLATTSNAASAFYLQDRRGDPRYRAVSKLDVPEELSPVLLNFVGNAEQLKPLYEALGQFGDALRAEYMPDTYESGIVYLEVSHPQANKGDALIRWAEMVGCAPDDVTVFGDNLNDIELFQAAGVGVAVANAREELKAHATEITYSNVDDGVARYLIDTLGLDLIAIDRVG